MSLQDYYAADMHDEVIPEEHVMRLTMSDFRGVDNLSPKLCVPVTIADRKYSLTGILPKSEFQAKATPCCLPASPHQRTPKASR